MKCYLHFFIQLFKQTIIVNFLQCHYLSFNPKSVKLLNILSNFSYMNEIIVQIIFIYTVYPLVFYNTL